MGKKWRKLGEILCRTSAFTVTIWAANVVKDFYGYDWISVEGIIILLMFAIFFVYQTELIERVLFPECSETPTESSKE